MEANGIILSKLYRIVYGTFYLGEENTKKQKDIINTKDKIISKQINDYVLTCKYISVEIHMYMCCVCLYVSVCAIMYV